MKINYKKYGDYYLPDLALAEKENRQLNKYGLLRLEYLKNHKKALYQELLMKDKLNEHLFSVSKNADALLNTLIENYIKSDEKLTEKSKEINPIEWTKLMNNYKNIAEEIVLKEYVFD